MQQKIISNGCEIVRRESVDEFTTVVVGISSDNDYEFGIIREGRIEAESFMGYTNPAIALRDGLMYAASGLILCEQSLGKATAFVYIKNGIPAEPKNGGW